MIEPTLQEKYDFLCQNLRMTSMDYWENDGLVEEKQKIYFQFSHDEIPTTIDEAVILSISSAKFYEL